MRLEFEGEIHAYDCCWNRSGYRNGGRGMSSFDISMCLNLSPSARICNPT
jgi:hypothetical protein